MKYQHEQMPLPRLALFVACMKPKLLHQYVVMVKRRLVYYRDKKVALEHRRRERRKELKTTFL